MAETRRVSLRIINTEGHPAATRVEMVITGEPDIDLTALASVYWPIQIVIEEKGAFALLKIPVEMVDIPGPVKS